MDITSLLRDIITLDLDDLEPIYTLFVKEFRQIKIELEPIDVNGNFESSYYNILEKKPSSPPLNAQKFLGEPDDNDYDSAMAKLLNIYEKLAAVPRVTREILAIIVDRGRVNQMHELRDQYTILPKTLEKIMRIGQEELFTEIDILEDAGLASLREAHIDDRKIYYLAVKGEQLNYLLSWLVEQKISVRTFLNTMDFTVLDEKIIDGSI
ncbi:MAG: hypothetical protein P4L41_03045 [Flavipsychrobacter sp.]|nr:hypothetical protein [Flavipsychrobacter sp.]